MSWRQTDGSFGPAAFAAIAPLASLSLGIRPNPKSLRDFLAHRFKRIDVLGVLLSGTLAAGCGKPLTPDECSQLLDKYVILLAGSDRPEVTAEQRNHMRQRAKELSKRDPQFSNCHKQVSRGKFDCAMNAPNTDLFEQCLM
jgi:hypothetical protein